MCGFFTFDILRAPLLDVLGLLQSNPSIIRVPLTPPFNLYWSPSFGFAFFVFWVPPISLQLQSHLCRVLHVVILNYSKEHTPNHREAASFH